MLLKKYGIQIFSIFWFIVAFLSSGEDRETIRVGVLDGWGATSLVSSLCKEKDMKAFKIERIKAEILEGCDVLIVTQQIRSGLLMRSIQTIVGWVNGGGGILFLHDAVGYRAHIGMFPSVGVGFNNRKQEKLRIVKEHPVTHGIAVGHIFSPGFKYDHIVIKTGVDGETVVDNENGESVVVVGKAGNGRVILSGMLTGYWGGKEDSSGYEKEPEGEERQILINSVHWLAEKRFIENYR